MIGAAILQPVVALLAWTMVMSLFLLSSLALIALIVHAAMAVFGWY